MPVTNSFMPSPMPAPAKMTAPVAPTQPSRPVDAEAKRDTQNRFANTLDARVQAGKAAEGKAAQGPATAEASAEGKEAGDAKAVAETEAAEASLAVVDDAAQLAQLSAALLAAFGNAAPAANPTQAPGTTAQTDADGALGLAAIAAGAVSADGNALPATADPAAQALIAGPTGQGSLANAGTGSEAKLAGGVTEAGAAPTGSTPLQAPGLSVADKPGKLEAPADALQASASKAGAESLAPANTTPQPPVHAFHDALTSRTPEAPRAEAPQFAVRTPVSNPGWTEDIGNRMVWMAGKELGRAELILTPPHLGRVEISLRLDGEQTSATFVTATPAAREAIEQALPRLRELMTDAGLNLSQVNVSANSGKDPSQERAAWGSGTRAGVSANGNDDAEPLSGVASRPVLRSGLGMIDTFA
ncbi:flagellar hook-length control protein FliK [Niveibacterium sp. 24ML]|uniref:flagellar hook-length control protein FliK n=1 Tax=Niveibacterium sp. 24ML TaxID=2985512 RepID=UPI00226F5738|nr:flagellar hook-length control protein FliK [Niveibacterium sp. 24ML]MCX9157939.1 flagellar hook-length control protein FliK [Niveibacterium sp. 24ML]